ncbi:Hypothetical predicted protein [Olea europaea subsp. europaea]|uniref:Protein TIFY n=2 Tax=Olea europaea subsp. europaea TaxID=158383 RepID=A0A8S0U3H5_OLEEU|nr:Hypothetical predicted protein [Olea europaea subsp. europaea]
MDSSRFSGHYLGGMDGLGNLSLGLTTQNFELEGAPTGTLNLLSTIDNSGGPTQLVSALPQYIGGYGSTFSTEKAQNGTVNRSEAETAQMVIFYAGQVLVFNDFPVEKANEIMMVATGQKHPTNAVPPPYMVPSPAESTTNSPGFDRLHFHHQPPLGSDLPMARKNSLARFLEKRKNRINAAKSPYQASNQTAAKGSAWLGLGPRFPFQVEVEHH